MFQGFSEKTGGFLWELAFHNERPWFHAHKQEFEEAVNTPFKALARDCYESFCRLLPGFEGRVHVSRIYRDARRLFGRGPYKDHLWFTITASDAPEPGPDLWFMLEPAQYAYGLGFFEASPTLMADFRAAVDANPARFRRLARAVENKGFRLGGPEYKRPKGLHDDAVIDRWYNRRYLFLEKRFDLGGAAFTPELPQIVSEAFLDLMPMHDFLLEVCRARSAETPREPR